MAKRDPGAGVDHRVDQGQSIDSLAYEYGHAGDTLWDHPRNQKLDKQRGDSRVLFPGDVVHVPAIRPAMFDTAETGRRHTYRRKDYPSLLRFRPMILGQDAPNARFEVWKDGVVIGSGVTNSHGDVECEVVPDEAGLEVRVWFGEIVKEYAIAFRALDPIEETRGVQQRLAGLGFYAGAIDGEAGPLTERAIAEFRMSCGIHEGEGITDQVRDAIHTIFGG
jgi:hypothetical protein